MVSSTCPSRTISYALRTFTSAEVATALAATDAMDAPPEAIDLAVIDSTARNAAATHAAAMDAAAAAIDTMVVTIDMATINSATIDLAAMYAARDVAMVVAVMDAVDVVVGALPLSPKQVVRLEATMLEATMYSPTKTSSETQAIATTATGWRTIQSTSMPFPQGQQVPPASPHHWPVPLASPRHQLQAWLIGPT